MRRNGFTLIELSIVMAIVGLLIGGIMLGRQMQKNQELRRVLVDARGYAIAVDQFKEKYGELPGDFSNAVRLWGKADGDTDITTNCAAPKTNVSVGKLTCNGNGDGRIASISSPLFFETWRAWQHLSAAELIKGSYSGIGIGTGNQLSQAGVNIPEGPLLNTGFLLTSPSSSGYYYETNAVNLPVAYIIFGAINPNKITAPYFMNPGLTPAEAYELDTKMDDGTPGNGQIETFVPSPPGIQFNCTSSTSQATAIYLLNVTSQTCALIFRDGFAKVIP